MNQILITISLIGILRKYFEIPIHSIREQHVITSETKGTA